MEERENESVTRLTCFVCKLNVGILEKRCECSTHYHRECLSQLCVDRSSLKCSQCGHDFHHYPFIDFIPHLSIYIERRNRLIWALMAAIVFAIISMCNILLPDNMAYFYVSFTLTVIPTIYLLFKLSIRTYRYWQLFRVRVPINENVAMEVIGNNGANNEVDGNDENNEVRERNFKLVFKAF